MNFLMPTSSILLLAIPPEFVTDAEGIYFICLCTRAARGGGLFLSATPAGEWNHAGESSALGRGALLPSYSNSTYRAVNAKAPVTPRNTLDSILCLRLCF